MAIQACPFPDSRPDGYAPLVHEPAFDPAHHLALEAPQRTWTPEDFGDAPEVMAATPSPVAAAGPFRVLSDEGVVATPEVCRALHEERRMESDQSTSSCVPGAVYRSRFLRDLTASPEIAALLSDLARTVLITHAMPSQRVYINHAPDDLTKAADNWHVDSIGFDYVLLASDPAALKGGRFEFFRGPLDEAAGQETPSLLTEGYLDDLPADRVETIDFPGPGCGVFQQGHLVLHRATCLLEPAERITTWGEPGILAELARRKAPSVRRRAGMRSENELDPCVHVTNIACVAGEGDSPGLR